MRIGIASALIGAMSLLGVTVAGCEEQRLDEEQREEYEEALEEEPVLEAEQEADDEIGPNQRLGQEGLVGGGPAEAANMPEAYEPEEDAYDPREDE